MKKLFWPGDAFPFPHHARKFTVPAGHFEVEDGLATRLLQRHAGDGMIQVVDSVPVDQLEAASRARHAKAVRLGGQQRKLDDRGKERQRSTPTIRGDAGSRLPGIPGRRAVPPPVVAGPPQDRLCSGCLKPLAEGEAGTCDPCAVAAAVAANKQQTAVTPPSPVKGKKPRTKKSGKGAAA